MVFGRVEIQKCCKEFFEFRERTKRFWNRFPFRSFSVSTELIGFSFALYNLEDYLNAFAS